MRLHYLLPLAGFLALAGCQDEKKVEPAKNPPAATAPATPPATGNAAPTAPTGTPAPATPPPAKPN